MKVMSFSPVGGTVWQVSLDGMILGTCDCAGDDMEDVELYIRDIFGLCGDVECPEYPY